MNTNPDVTSGRHVDAQKRLGRPGGLDHDARRRVARARDLKSDSSDVPTLGTSGETRGAREKFDRTAPLRPLRLIATRAFDRPIRTYQKILEGPKGVAPRGAPRASSGYRLGTPPARVSFPLAPPALPRRPAPRVLTPPRPPQRLPQRLSRPVPAAPAPAVVPVPVPVPGTRPADPRHVSIRPCPHVRGRPSVHARDRPPSPFHGHSHHAKLRPAPVPFVPVPSPSPSRSPRRSLPPRLAARTV